MRLRNRFCKFVFRTMLAAASVGGAPLRPDEVEELMHTMNQPKIAHTLPDDAENGDDPIKKLLGRGAHSGKCA
jgi:hypothetical protein